MRRIKYRLADTAGYVLGFPGSVRQPRGVRVLMFHGVDDDVDADHELYNHSIDRFCSHILAVSDWLSDHGQTFVALHDTSTSGICLTFDDGYASIARTVCPFLIDRGIPFHVFVPVELCDMQSGLHLSRAQIRDLATEPLVGIGSHGYSHVPLAGLAATKLRHELTRSRGELEELTGREITSMSYPFGSFGDEVCHAVREAGFTRAATSQPGILDSATDLLRIPRTDIWAMDSNRTVINKIRGGWDLLL